MIKPDSDPMVFKDTSAAKQALLNGQVDAILADLPTAFYITAVEIPKSTIVGQFQAASGSRRSSGCSSRRARPLVACVNQALAALREDGTLDSIRAALAQSDVADVPVAAADRARLTLTSTRRLATPQRHAEAAARTRCAVGMRPRVAPPGRDRSPTVVGARRCSWSAAGADDLARAGRG